MSELTLPDLAAKMRHIDFTMLSSRSETGEISSRPMSNNGDVEYDGDSYFFAMEPTRLIEEIERDPNVGLSLQGAKGLLGKPPLFVSIEGKAELIRDKAAVEAHWTSDMNRWAKDGPQTPGVVLIKVHATKIQYWDGEDEGEIAV